MEVLRCETLTKTYQSGGVSVHALRDVTLSFAQGSFTAVTGRSGSGKSTLLHMLSGLDRPTSGRIIYQDHDLARYNDNQLSVLRRRRFGFVFQSYNLVRELTAQENILLPVAGLSSPVRVPVLPAAAAKGFPADAHECAAGYGPSAQSKEIQEQAAAPAGNHRCPCGDGGDQPHGKRP